MLYAVGDFHRNLFKGHEKVEWKQRKMSGTMLSW